MELVRLLPNDLLTLEELVLLGTLTLNLSMTLARSARRPKPACAKKGENEHKRKKAVRVVTQAACYTWRQHTHGEVSSRARALFNTGSALLAHAWGRIERGRLSPPGAARTSSVASKAASKRRAKPSSLMSLGLTPKCLASMFTILVYSG